MWWAQFDGHHLPLRADEGFLEHGLVDHPAYLGGSRLVDEPDLGEKVENHLPGLLGASDVVFPETDSGLGFGDLPGESRLFFLEEIQRDGLLIVGVQELAAFVLEPGERGALTAGFAVDSLAACFEGLPNVGGERIKPGQGKAFCAHSVFHSRLDALNRMEGHGAAGMASPPITEEVGVDTAVALRVGQAETPATFATVEGALQVVGVPVVAFPGGVVGVKNVLDPVVEVRVDQRRVPAFVFDAAEANDPHVVGVAERLVQRRDGQRLGATLRGGPVREALVGQQLVELVQRVVARGVQLERQPDEGGTLAVDGDRLDLPPIDDLPDRAIADGTAVGGAPDLGFLQHAFENFLAEVAAVELGDGLQNPLQKLPRGRVIDVLGDGDESDPRLLQFDGHQGGIKPVSSPAVDLVDDDVVDVTLLPNPFEHGLEGRPVIGLGGLGQFDVFIGDLQAETLRFAPDSLALRRYGQPFGVLILDLAA